MPKPPPGIYTSPPAPFIRFYNRHLPNSYFLCNFYPSQVTIPTPLGDKTFKCSEAAWHALRCKNPEHISDFLELDGHQSWALAQDKKRDGIIVPNEDNDLALMNRVVLAKFEQSAELREKLLATGEAYLVERAKKDSFWGDACDGSGANNIGRICMAVRGILGGVGDVDKPAEYLDFASKYPKHW